EFVLCCSLRAMRRLATLIAISAAAILAASQAHAVLGGGHGGGHHHHHHFGFWWPGYITYAPPFYTEPQPVFLAPAQSIPTFACNKRRETITVPAEGGGESKVTVTRCN